MIFFMCWFYILIGFEESEIERRNEMRISMKDKQYFPSNDRESCSNLSRGTFCCNEG